MAHINLTDALSEKTIDELMAGTFDERCEAIAMLRQSVRWQKEGLKGLSQRAASAIEAQRESEAELVAYEKRLQKAVDAAKEAAR